MHEIYQAAKTVLKAVSAIDTERLRRFRRHLFEFKEYLRNNWKNLTNYADAYRRGLRISSAPAESGMSHLVNQRMGKRQPMRWSAEGAHQLLQVRCAVLDRRFEAFEVSLDTACRTRGSCMTTAPTFVPRPDSSPSARNFSVRYPKGDELLAVEATKRAEDYMAARTLAHPI
jgi:hypothetical protein